MATVKFKGELEVNLSGTELNVGQNSTLGLKATKKFKISLN